jgi:hypothetical protein
MPDTNIAFSNVVPNTTPASWSQAYNAGKLFAVLSLGKEVTETPDSIDLNVLGKDVISTFEQEFFTLENKDLDSIKNAISIALEKIKTLPSFSFVITYISGSVLYVFITGGGSVILKRGSKMGAILEDENGGVDIKSASGFLHNDDLIVLQTRNFTKIVNLQALAQALDSDNPSSISESLAPKIHEKQDGSAAAVIMLYKDDKVVESLSSVDPLAGADAESSNNLESNFSDAKTDNFEEISLENLESPETVEVVDTKVADDLPIIPPVEAIIPPISEELPTPPLSEMVMNAPEENQTDTPLPQEKKKRSIHFPKIGLGGIGHRRRLLLSIAVIIVIVLGAAIFLGIKSKNDKATKEAFAAVYAPAKQKYEEGKSLEDLNSQLATQDFTDAKNLLSENRDKFKTGSSEDNQIEDLLAQVNSELDKTSGSNNIEAKEVPLDTSKLLSTENATSNGTYFTQDDKNVYFINSSGIQAVNKSTGKTTQIVKKSWTTPGGNGEFLGNIYVLDKGNNQIYKFASGTFAKSNYLSASSSADLADTNAMAIDGSVYVLSKDGSIQKFLRGASQPFSITGLSQPLSNPTKIYTNSDSDNLYVLDNGNSRIVVFDKNGKYITEYSSSVIKNAKDFEVVEKDKKVYVLSGGKAYEIDIK